MRLTYYKHIKSVCSNMLVSIIFVCLSIIPRRCQAVFQPPAFADVETTSGPVRGRLLHTILDQRPYYSFKGIPYAESPAFGRRFLPPQPKRRWQRRRDCFHFGSVCTQFNPRNTTEIIGSEDCLHLNVYIPALVDRSVADLTVMVFIHGGGFMFGSGDDDLQGPDLLLRRGDLILVTLNYRLGVFGFASLGTPEYSGNQGLKDQQLALRWVYANAPRFGGSRDRITLFGQSAGAAASLFHTLAPGSRGLFQRTIQMSFTFDIWAIFRASGHHLQELYEFAATCRYPATHYGDLLALLRTATAEQLVRGFPVVQYDAERLPLEIRTPWLPVVENSAALQPFLQGTPTQLLQMRQFDRSVAVMAGYTSAEALFYATPNLLRPSTLDAFNASFRIELPSESFNRRYESEAYARVAQQIRREYFPGGVAVNADHATLQSYIQLLSNVYQNVPFDRRLRLMARVSRAPVFMYRFGLQSPLNYYTRWLGADSVHARGASHADDMCYVFHCGYMPEAYRNVTHGSRVDGFIRTMTGMYANFAKYGDPLVAAGGGKASRRLRRSTAARLNYVDIGTRGALRLAENPLAARIRFWERIVHDSPELFTHDVDGCVDQVIRALLDEM